MGFILMLLFCFGFLNQAEATSLAIDQKQKVRIYPNGSKRAQGVINLFEKLGIGYEMVNALHADASKLYIIFDAFNVAPELLPKHYIVYQTRNLEVEMLDHEYMNILEDAIAIWDYSWANIDVYRHLISHYAYLPERCDCADPVMLPCLLPTAVLKNYKHVLIDSNTDDTAISSHLPALFCYAYANYPKVIVEDGVADGHSSRIFNRVAHLLDAQLLGVEVNKDHEAIYKPLSNGLFLHMKDLNFADYYAKSFFKNLPIKIIFIGITYSYQHSMQALSHFVPLLANGGIIILRDTNPIPLTVKGKPGWWRLNNTYGQMPKGSKIMCDGLAKALSNFFDIDFNVDKYQSIFFRQGDTNWHLVHYPFCNGLTVLKKEIY
jgi:hypothetical protein